MGFSLQTFLPALIAILFRRPCSCMLVRFTIRSKAGPASNFSMEGKLLGIEYFFAAFTARSGMMSHVLTNSTYGDLERWGRYWVETLPQPMIATLIFFC